MYLANKFKTHAPVLLGIEVHESVVLHREELVVVVGRDEIVRLDEGGLVAHGHVVISHLVIVIGGKQDQMIKAELYKITYFLI